MNRVSSDGDYQWMLRLVVLVALTHSLAGCNPVGLAGGSSKADRQIQEVHPTEPRSRSTALNYPAARKSDQVDDYHGKRIADPYRWLEDADSQETRDWIAAENRLSEDYLAAVPQRPWIRKRLELLWNYERYGIPTLRGGRYFYTRNEGLQNQAVLYTTMDLGAEPRVLLDPNTLSADGTVALTGTKISEDGRLLAYGLAAAGSDWQEWRVRDVETGRDLDDHIRWVKFSAASWTKDNRGFFYSRYDEPAEGAALTGTNYFQKLYYHRLGTPQAEDRLIYHRDDEREWGFGAEVTEDGRYLVVNVWRGTERKNLVFYLDLETPDAQMIELVKEWDAQYRFVGNDGPIFWLQTDLEAPHSRLIAVDITRPDRKEWREVIPETDEVLEEVNLVGERFMASYLRDAHTLVNVFDLSGKFTRQIDLPGLGTAAGFNGRRADTETFYAFTSFTMPTTIYHYDLATGESTEFRRPLVDFRPDEYETVQIFYESKDGTRVPMFITYKKSLVRDGRNPTLLYGYGGFNASMTPSFSVANLVWLEMGGVYAVANLRGGGEYGRGWHEAGKKANKQNVFDDFIAAAEYLVKEQFTSPENLAIEGHSNGGLLVGACLTQRPNLFGAALPGVGVMDMLRFHKFTIGWAWVSEYGSSDVAEDFDILRAYSPLHNIRSTTYPPTFITTADHDDRVVPAHSFKFAATLPAAQAGEAPILIRIETSARHGAGKPTSKIIDEIADGFSFLAKALEIAVPAVELPSHK